MSRKTQHTRFEDKILRKFANEDKPPVVHACEMLRDVLRWSKMLRHGPRYSEMVPDTPIWSMPQNRGHGLCRWVRLGVGLETQPRSGWDQYTEPAKHLPSWTLSLSPGIPSQNFWGENPYSDGKTVIMLPRVFTFQWMEAFLFSQQTNLSSSQSQFSFAWPQSPTLSPKLQCLWFRAASYIYKP